MHIGEWLFERGQDWIILDLVLHPSDTSQAEGCRKAVDILL